jgi:hypothetical protein
MQDMNATDVHFNNSRCLDFLYHQLSHAVPFFD